MASNHRFTFGGGTKCNYFSLGYQEIISMASKWFLMAEGLFRLVPFLILNWGTFSLKVGHSEAEEKLGGRGGDLSTAGKGSARLPSYS